MQHAYDYCEALVRTADSNRYLAGLFAPADARRHLYALHAFAAEIARVGEAVREPLAGEIRLQWWREALCGERPEAAGNPVAAAILDTLARYALPREPLIALIDAHGFTLQDEPMATLAALDAYAEATEGTLFALGAALLASDAAAGGAMAVAARLAGIAYGVALRLLSLPRDAARGKIFVPLDMLERNGATRADIERRRDSPCLRATLAPLRDHAQSAFAAFAAAAALPACAAPAFLPAALVPLMARRSNRDPFAVAEAPQWRRQWVLWRAARRWPKVRI